MAKFSLCIEAVLPEIDFYDRIKIAAELGYDAIEFWDIADKDTDKIGKLAQENNIPIAICCIKNAWNDRCRLSESPASVVKNVSESAKIAKSMGCKSLIGLSGDMKGYHYDETPTLIANLSRCAEVLKKEDVTLNVEALNSIVNHANYFLDSSYVGFNIMKSVGSSHVKLLYDCYHMQIMEGNLVQNITNNIEFIGHFHSAGVPGRNELQGGETNYGKVIGTIDSLGYDRFFGLEYWTSYDPMKSLKDTIDYVKSL
ncbi:MAG: TIM barrel protein [Clostridiales bacterium]|jgi:hydroxypyruvate isomerase|nr:TIM barrel protein [Clostridiales bacterium]